MATVRVLNVSAAVLLVVGLAGCGSAQGQADIDTPSHVMEPGMIMGSATAMGSGTPEASAVRGVPSPTALMVCGSEIRDAIVQMLALSHPPMTTSSYVDRLFTCTYQLTAGPLVLLVKDASSNAAAGDYFTSMRSGVQSSTDITGIASFGLPAFENADGIAAFVKDDKVLYVDATQLTGTLGPFDLRPRDVAYKVATAVLACWRERD